MKRSRLRPVSKKRQRERSAFEAVYAEVDRRSGDRCEACRYRPGTERHHTVRPRRSNHVADKVILLCRACHKRCDWPYAKGRLVITPLGEGKFEARVVWAANKFEARREKLVA